MFQIAGIDLQATCFLLVYLFNKDLFLFNDG